MKQGVPICIQILTVEVLRVLCSIDFYYLLLVLLLFANHVKLFRFCKELFGVLDKIYPHLFIYLFIYSFSRISG